MEKHSGALSNNSDFVRAYIIPVQHPEIEALIHLTIVHFRHGFCQRQYIVLVLLEFPTARGGTSPNG